MQASLLFQYDCNRHCIIADGWAFQLVCMNSSSFAFSHTFSFCVDIVDLYHVEIQFGTLLLYCEYVDGMDLYRT
jgi:hypothetical protein